MAEIWATTAVLAIIERAKKVGPTDARMVCRTNDWGLQMKHRQRVDELAQRFSEDRQRLWAQQAASVQDLTSMHQRALSEAERKLREVSRDLRGGVGVYVRRRGMGLQSELVLSVSTAPPWVRRPFQEWRINPTTLPDSAQAAHTHSFRYRAQGSTPATAGVDSLPIEGVVSMIEQTAAQLISGSRPFSYEPPVWYQVVGAAVAIPLAAIAWLVCVGAWGWMGLFFGWIPALLVYSVARPLWLMFGLLGLIWAVAA